jgi:hypothetical protein
MHFISNTNFQHRLNIISFVDSKFNSGDYISLLGISAFLASLAMHGNQISPTFSGRSGAIGTE